MKNILIPIISTSLLTSCLDSTPKLNDLNEPFIIYRIENIDNTHSRYTSKTDGLVYYIDLPSGMYNINDTIIIYKKK